MTRALEIGAAGEHLVCADLLYQGFKAALAPAGAFYDIIVDLDGAVLKVAVKSTEKARPRAGRKLTRPCYQFGTKRSAGRKSYTTKEADIIAFVGVDEGRIAYMPVEGCPQVVHFEAQEVQQYPNTKGPKNVKCREFSDFSWGAALEELFKHGLK